MEDFGFLIKGAVIIALIAVTLAVIGGGIGWVAERPVVWLPVLALLGFLIYRRQQRNRV
jgi:hypothetical protein